MSLSLDDLPVEGIVKLLVKVLGIDITEDGEVCSHVEDLQGRVSGLSSKLSELVIILTQIRDDGLKVRARLELLLASNPALEQLIELEEQRELDEIREAR